MKAYELRNQSKSPAGSPAGGPALAMVERPRPQVAAGEVLVRMRAVSLNFRDLLISKSPRTAPLVPLCDGAGEVVEAGEGVTRVKTGDRVAGTYFQDWVAGPLTASVFRTVLGQTIDG